LEINFKVVLFQPEIPGNTGSIGRTCVALGIELILIKPYGFDITEKAVRRAGLDYWKHLKLKEYDSWEEFIKSENPASILFFDNFTEQLYDEAPYQENSYLIFGSETSGFPPNLMKQFEKNIYKLPMYSKVIRSLNLSNSVTAIAYECLRNLR